MSKLLLDSNTDLVSAGLNVTDGFLFITFGEIDRESLREREREFPKLNLI